MINHVLVIFLNKEIEGIQRFILSTWIRKVILKTKKQTQC